MQRPLAGRRQLIGLAAPPVGAVDLALDEPQLLEPSQLGIDLAVARGPEEAGRDVHERLDLVAGAPPELRASRGSRRRSCRARSSIGMIYPKDRFVKPARPRTSFGQATYPHAVRLDLYLPRSSALWRANLGPFIGSSDFRRRRDRSHGDRARRSHPAPALRPTKVIPLDFGWSPTAPTPGQVVTFTAEANPPSGVAIRSYDWDLNGDGSIDKHGADRDVELSGAGARQRAAARDGRRETRRRCCPHGVGPGRGRRRWPCPDSTCCLVHDRARRAGRQSAGAVHVHLQRPRRHPRRAGLGSQRRRQLRQWRRRNGISLLRRCRGLRGGAPGDGQCRARLLRLADADGRTCAGGPCPDTDVGTATVEPVPGRADDGPDHRGAGRACGCCA